MDLFVLNNSHSDGKRPEITRLPQSSGIFLVFCSNFCWSKGHDKQIDLY